MLKQITRTFRRYTGIAILIFLCSELLQAQNGSITVSDIQIYRLPVLPDSIFFSSVINRLHVPTRDYTISKNLLFSTGDTIDSVTIADSEKLLRDLPYINQVRIFTIPSGRDSAIVRIEYHEQWSTFLGGSYQVAEGNARYGFRFREANFLGLGLEVKVVSDRIPEGHRTEYTLKEKNFLGSFADFTAQWKTDAMGTIRTLDINREYGSSQTIWCYNAYGEYFSGSVQQGANKYDGVTKTLLSAGVRRVYGQNWKYLPGVQVVTRTENIPEKPDNRIINLNTGLDIMRVAFRKKAGINISSDYETVPEGMFIGTGIGRDINSPAINYQITAKAAGLYAAGYAAVACTFGAVPDSRRQTLSLQFSYVHFFTSSATILKIRSARLQNALELDRISYLDCRALPNRELWTDSYALCTIEQRFFSLFQLPIASFGCVVFADAATTNNFEGSTASVIRQMHFGMGLRIEPTFLSGIKVLRLDVGYAPEKQRFIFSFGAEQLINPLLKLTN